MTPSLPRRAHHIVRFSAHDDDLIPAIADFVADGIRLGERVWLTLSRDRWQAVEALLVSQHVRIVTALKHEQVFVTDVDEALAQITVDGRIDMSRVAAMCAPMLALPPPIRIFGELAPRIAARGELAAAMEIEKNGESLSRGLGVNILCAYHVDQMSASDDCVARVCAAHDAAVPGGGAMATVGPVVLLAQEGADLRDRHEAHLRSRGFQVVSASDGLQALSLARMARPSVVLLDVRLPGMSGAEAAQLLKKDPSFLNVPILALPAAEITAAVMRLANAV
jgi:CheY-like chemotaxis protein